MTTDTKIIIGAIATSVIIIVAAAFAMGKDNSPKRENLGQAAMSIDKTTADLGTMKVSDERTATFTLTNTSDAPLRLWGVTTSCNCTFATLTIDGTPTGEFSMHAGGPLKNWIGEVAPKGEATLTVIYRPSVMPVQGPVSRSVTFATNDPKNSEVTVTVNATVE